MVVDSGLHNDGGVSSFDANKVIFDEHIWVCTCNCSAHANNSYAWVRVIISCRAGELHLDRIPGFGITFRVLPEPVRPEGADQLVVGKLGFDPAQVGGHQLLFFADQEDAHFATIQPRPVDVVLSGLEEDVHRQTFAHTGGFEVSSRHEGHFAVGRRLLEEITKPPMEVRVEDVFAIEGEDVLPEVVQAALGLFLHARDESTLTSNSTCLTHSTFGVDHDLVAAGVEGLFDGGGFGGRLRLGRLEFEH